MSNADQLRAGIPSRAEVRQRGFPLTPEELHAIERWQQQWLVENNVAIESSNRWVEEHGLPIAKYRMF